MKVMLEKIKKRLLHNWTLKLASLFLAFVIWFVVAQVGDPQDSRPYSNIQVRLINTDLLEDQNKVYEVLDRTDIVRVTVTAPTSVFQTLRASDIVAEADVSKLTDINTIAITYYSLNSNLDVVSFEGDHDVVRLNVEDRESKWVRIAYQTVGTVAGGYIIGSTKADQTLINITGPKSAVSQVGSAYAELNVEGATNDMSANVDIYLRDLEGNRIELNNIEKSADHLYMTTEVLATKEVPIEARVSGQPAEGYMVTEKGLVSQESVLIAGTMGNLANINRIVIPEEKLDITGISEDKTFTINLRDCLPNNVRLAESDFNGRVTVEVHVKPSRERTVEVPASNFSFLNVPEGFVVKPAVDEGGTTQPVQLRVHGIREDVNALRSSLIQGTADVADWMRKQEITQLVPGIYEIPTICEVDERITVLESGKVRVEIRSAAADAE